MKPLLLRPTTTDIERVDPAEPSDLHGRDPGWIFDDALREFHWIERVVAVEPHRRGVDLRVATHQQEPLTVRISFVTPQVVRVQCQTPQGSLDRSSPMLVGRPQPVRVRVGQARGRIRVASDTIAVEIERQPWRLQLVDADGRTVFAHLADRDYRRFITYPTGVAVDRATGHRHVYESFALRHDEHVYGLGERYGAFDRRGLRTVLWSVDTNGANSTDLAYKPVPFFVSTAGYGLFIHTTARAVVDLGAVSTVSGWLYVEEPVLDYFLIYGPSLAAIRRRYLDLTGHPAVPPRWSFGIWLSRCMYRNRREVEAVVTQARRHGIPCDVIHLDPLWLTHRRRQDYDSCDFRWDEAAFGSLPQLVRWLRQRGVRLSLWENPYFPMRSPLFAPAAARGYFLRQPDGAPARFKERDAAIVDFTNPRAYRWYQDLHRPLLRQGVAVFKPDYGEGVPADALAADGRTGADLHNVYPLLYTRAVFDVTAESTDQPVVWARSGWAGSQRYPLHWSGDAPSRWEVLPSILASGLSLALSGFAFWSHDIGGFYGLTDPRLYVRWAQLGLLTSHARFHGKEPREPWRMGGAALRIVRECAQLRYRLLPYLYSEARAAVDDGLPLMRPLVLEFQHDPAAAAVADQYLLGRALMVAPVLTERDERDIYLPQGTWWEFRSGRRWDGPRWLHLAVPLPDIPIFVRGNTILPLGPAVQHSGERADPLTFDVRLTDAAAYTLHTDAGPIVLAAHWRGPAVIFRARGGAGRHIVRLPDIIADRVTIRGRGRLLAVRAMPDVTEMTVQARGAYTLSATRK